MKLDSRVKGGNTMQRPEAMRRQNEKSIDFAWSVGARKRGESWQIEALATKFVNCRLHAMPDLMTNPSEAEVRKEVAPDKGGQYEWLHPPKRPNEPGTSKEKRAQLRTNKLAAARQALLKKRYTSLAMALQKLWKKPLTEDAERLVNDALDWIFSARRLGGEQPALRLHVGAPAFEPRDLLDAIAFAVLQASKRGLLRMCKGRKRGWECPAPYLVAVENRNVYCPYCADRSRWQSKTEYIRKRRSSKRRAA